MNHAHAARRRHHRRPHSYQPFGCAGPCKPSPLTPAQIEDLPPLMPSTCPLHLTRCSLCGDRIFSGQTWFRPIPPTPLVTWACYHCGVSLEMYRGSLTIEEALRMPPYGGPLKTEKTSSPSQ